MLLLVLSLRSAVKSGLGFLHVKSAMGLFNRDGFLSQHYGQILFDVGNYILPLTIQDAISTGHSIILDSVS